ncbi:MAG: hypothetical protein IPK19_37840 [Chloroflexi bacterium]|nr:hypothetical protein [Chloroflexota bacterium]
MKGRDRNKIRFTVGFTPEQASRLDELHRTRSRRGDPTSRADLVPRGGWLYLQHQPDLVGSRKAIAKDLEGKIDALDAKGRGSAGAVRGLRRERDTPPDGG